MEKVSVLQQLPRLTLNAGPQSPQWPQRVKEQLTVLIKYVQLNKQLDNDWFKIEPDSTCKLWKGTCWHIHQMVKYTFKLEFQIPSAYPNCPIELVLPQLDGLTPKMYRGGKICQDIHFAPLWSKNSPGLGIAHALAMSLGPWLAAQVPELVYKKAI